MTTPTVRYFVSDMKAAIDFYTTRLDFRVHMQPASGFAALVRDDLRLLLNLPGAGGAGKNMPDGRSPKPGGWNRIQLQVEDLESVYSNLKKENITLRNTLVTGKGGKQVLIEDPSGNPVELFESNENDESNISYKPKGYSNVTPYLAIRNADELVIFLKKVFDAEEQRLWRHDDGSFMHGEFRIGDTLVMIGDVQDRHDPFPCMLYVYVPSVDDTYLKAMEEGADSVEEPADQNYGDRRAAFSDSTGNKWYIASRLSVKNVK